MRKALTVELEGDKADVGMQKKGHVRTLRRGEDMRVIAWFVLMSERGR